jgi:hypothetical protein
VVRWRDAISVVWCGGVVWLDFVVWCGNGAVGTGGVVWCLGDVVVWWCSAAVWCSAVMWCSKVGVRLPIRITNVWLSRNFSGEFVSKFFVQSVKVLEFFKFSRNSS